MNSIKKVFTLVVVVVALIMAVALSSMNADSVALNLHWFQLNWPLGFMLLVFSALGLLLGLVLSWLLWLWPSNRQKLPLATGVFSAQTRD